jgi:predicted ATPase
MESLATPGTIVVSEHTYKLTAGYFEFKALGPAQIKGVSEPVHIFEVLRVGPLRTRLQVAARRGLVRFVGRQRELEQMRQALALAREGRGQIVAVMGEPGVGKSRLCYEFKQHAQPGFLVLETFSVSHGQAYAYLPLIELLKQYFRITLQDDERQRREKITGRLLALDRGLEDLLPYVFFLLGTAEPTSPLQQMDPQIRRRRMFEAIKRLLLRESLDHPLLLVFEDLHWLDAETQAFLAFLSDSIATTRILLLVNYRPEYQHSWGGKTYYTQLRLDPLGQHEAHELLMALLGDNTGLQPLKQRILADTEGNPFFIEEIVQALAEQGILVRDAGTGLKLVPTTTPLTAMRLPPTVQGVLASRIDRLPATEKSLLQTLAVIGKKFSLSLLTQVVNQPDEGLYPLLSHLQATEFIYEQPAFPELEYTFKHALTQEVAYNSLLLEPRRILHERAAQAIEAHYCDRLEDYYNELAHHYSRSGNTQKAVVYLQRAGEQALQRSAHGEALAHLTVALELLAPLPNTPDRIQQEIQLRLALGEVLVVTRGYTAPDVKQTYTQALELCQHVDDPSRRFRVLLGLWRFHFVRGEFRAAHDLASQLMCLVQQVHDLLPHMVAHLTQGLSLCTLGEWSTALTHLERSITCYDARKHGPDQADASAYELMRRGIHHGAEKHGPDQADASAYVEDPKVICSSYAALALWSLGYPDQALKRVYQALTLAHELSNPFSLAFAMYFVAFVHRLRREAQAVQERAEAVIALAEAHGFPFWVTLGTMLRSWALAEQGQATAGIAQIRQALASYRATGAEVEQSAILLIEACANAGLIDEGLSLLAEALAKAHNVGDLFGEVELYRLRGELLLRQAAGACGSGSTAIDPSRHSDDEAEATCVNPAPTDEAETCLRHALDVARRQGAKSLELRAALSLGRLWLQQRKRDETRLLLAETYNWFTEGFDTADLKEARALLDQLSWTTLGEGDETAE